MAEQQILIALAYALGLLFWLGAVSVGILLMVAAFEYAIYCYMGGEEVDDAEAD